jgi:hypothetical protein
MKAKELLPEIRQQRSYGVFLEFVRPGHLAGLSSLDFY